MASATRDETPYHIAVCLFDGFQALDVFGPLDILNVLSYKKQLKLSIIGPTKEPVTTRNKQSLNDQFQQHIVVTHSYADPPSGVNVLLIPGGFGAREDQTDLINYVRTVEPTLDYLLTVCTGSALAAKAGVLDGCRATSNKRAFEWVKSLSDKVEWVKKARWVEDHRMWTSSGISAGIDMTLAFVAHVWDQETAEGLAQGLEHDWHKDASWDPFADLY